MNRYSEERLSKLMPALATRVREIISGGARAGLKIEVVQGYRTFAEQEMLYAQGRTRKGPLVTNARGPQSFHCYGLAADLCPFQQGRPDWDDEKAFDQIGAQATRVGLVWGGVWKKPDRPHVQLSPFTVLQCFTFFREGGLARVWSEVERKLPR